MEPRRPSMIDQRSDGQTRKGTMDMDLVDEPEEDIVQQQHEATHSRLINGHVGSARPDEGYLLKGWRRALRDHEGEVRWWYTQSEKDGADAVFQKEPPTITDASYSPPDIFADGNLFPDAETTVQEVEFRKETPVPSKWYPPVKDIDAIEKLLNSPMPHDAWRWVHCEGLNGPTLKALAKTVDWPLRKFGGIFTWTRASMEWSDGVILVHFQNQSTRLFIWHGGGKYPVLITCTTLNSLDSSMTRVLDFVDRGCSRPEIVLRKDPSLMFYGILRAVIQDLRFSVHEIGKLMGEAFVRSTAQPTQANLSYFYHLQDRLFILSLDTTSLKNAAANLLYAAEQMEGRPNALISERTRIMIKDQMGLISLLNEELPDIVRRAEAIVNLAFNTLAFRTNNLLQILAVVTVASLPLTVVTGILGIQWFDDTKINGKQVAITLSVVGGVVIAGLIWFAYWFWDQRRNAKDDGSALAQQSKEKQTATMPGLAQRQAWARVQDLDRDNEIINHFRHEHNPMMRAYHPLDAPSPRSSSPPPPTSPSKRKTVDVFLRDTSFKRIRHGTMPSRGQDAIAEEGNSMTRLATMSAINPNRAPSPPTPTAKTSPPASHE